MKPLALISATCLLGRSRGHSKKIMKNDIAFSQAVSELTKKVISYHIFIRGHP